MASIIPNMPHRIVIGSCSHPRLHQPLWKPIAARRPAAFIWGGDSVYADGFVGLNWTAVDFSSVSSWTFPPPSVHVEATPEVLRSWYEEQWGVDDYRNFVMGWNEEGTNASSSSLTDEDSTVHAGVQHRPIIYGLIDDHDYGMNNGDVSYQYKNESNVAFVDFLYSGEADADDDLECTVEEKHTCEAEIKTRGRQKSNDPMYRRSLEGKGVYGVQLFDFSKRSTEQYTTTTNGVVWGGGYWVPDDIAKIDPDAIRNDNDRQYSSDIPQYSTTHSVAIFALDVRSNKSPWPKGKVDTRALDFLGQHQWEWLRAALNNSHATVNIIMSGLQIHPDRFPADGNVLEEWSKFPEARQLLYDTVLNSGARSPILVSGDVHMAQIMRRDCAKSSDIDDNKDNNEQQWNKTRTRPLVEITTSGMTHSWGTSFSSQVKNHRWPLKPYAYFVSKTFMTIAHYIVPMLDIVIKSSSDVTVKKDKDDDTKFTTGRGSYGMQYYLGLNFAEFEFDFSDSEKANVGGSLTVRIFGEEVDGPPKLEMRYTFDELSGSVSFPGTSARTHDFLIGQHLKDVRKESLQTKNDGWICVPHRGFASMYHEYASMVIMITTFCVLFFLPHGVLLLILIIAWQQLSKRRKNNTVHVNGHHYVNGHHHFNGSSVRMKNVNGLR